MSFEPRNVFITGGAGFIGANFVRHWLANAREGRVVVFDALTYAGNIENLAGLERDPRYVFVKGDICDEASGARRCSSSIRSTPSCISRRNRTSIARSSGPDDFIRTNIVGTHALLKAAKALWIDRKTVAGAPLSSCVDR